ncbi:MAG: LacI family DNA-binding transcriptional regulator [Geminicoccaceae bacterium]
MVNSVTLKDVARETGVHVSTVSRALDPTARRSISAEVVERVAAAAERMGYRPNRLATGLRTRRTMTVGIMLPDITNTLFPPMVRGIESVLEPAGYASILVNTDNDGDRELRLMRTLLDHGVDGIIDAAPSRADLRGDSLPDGLPIVTANRRTDASQIPAIISDDTAGIAEMLTYLHSVGHRRIAHIAGPEALSTGAARRRAFKETASALDLPLGEGAIAPTMGYHEDEGHRAATKLIESEGSYTAFLCANDRLALGAIDALREHGLRCPEDVSVTGFNDIPLLHRISPGLTTIRILKYEVGRVAAEILVTLMTEPEAQIPLTTVLPVDLIRRDSVAAPRTDLALKLG